MSFHNSNINKLKGFTLLKGGEVYDPFIGLDVKKDILLEDGLIVRISKNIKSSKNYNVIDCSNCILTNGFVDIHSHFREPGFEIKETVNSGSIAAFYGGYTRVCLMPNTSPVIDSPELVKQLINKNDSLPIHIYPIGAITKGQKGTELSEIGQMVSAGAIAISDDGIPVKNSQVFRMAVEYARKFNVPVINHAEDDCLVNSGVMNEGLQSLKLGLAGNPDIAESTMIYRDLSIAEYTSGKIHIPHVTSAKSVEIIKNFKNRGVDVTAEVTPHHLCLTEDILKNFNTNAKVAPPIRSLKDKRVLIDAVKNGYIDCIATDHAPHTIEDKEKDFNHAPCGMIGLESAFGLVCNTLLNEKVDIKSIINLFTINPCNVMNIKPSVIKVGNEAEINVIDANCKWKFKASDIHSKSKNSPIIGMDLLGKVYTTINKGYILNKK